jgi:hypothetical protein
VRAGVALHVAAMHLDHPGKEHGEEGDKQKGEGK